MSKSKITICKNNDAYSFTIKDHEFSFLRYIYNSCRLYWEKEVEFGGNEITQAEQKEHELCFIAKCAALGYMLYRYNDSAQLYLVYAIEAFDEQHASSRSKNYGGTGKSILLRALDYVREVEYVNGAAVNEKDGIRFLFSGVKRGVTN